MQKVQTLADICRLVEAGSTISGAVREAIDQHVGSIKAFAEHHEIDRSDLSKTINGTKAPTPRMITAFTAVFGGTELEWRALFHRAGEPVAAVAQG